MPGQKRGRYVDLDTAARWHDHGPDGVNGAQIDEHDSWHRPKLAAEAV